MSDSTIWLLGITALMLIAIDFMRWVLHGFNKRQSPILLIVAIVLIVIANLGIH